MSERIVKKFSEIKSDKLLEIMVAVLNITKISIGHWEFVNHYIVTETIDFAKLLEQAYNQLGIPIERETGNGSLNRIVCNHIFCLGNIIFNEEVTLSNIVFRKQVSFNGYLKLPGTSPLPVEFKKIVYFMHTIFYEAVDFNYIIFQNTTFVRTMFIEKADFYSANFSEATNFHSAEFHNEAIFTNAIFEKRVSFNFSKFYKKTTFLNTQFGNDVSFYAVTFNDIDFEDSYFNNKVNFDYTTFKNTMKANNIRLNDKSQIYFNKTNTHLSESDYNDTEIKITNTNISGRIDFNSDRIRKIDLSGSKIIGSGSLNLIEFNPKYDSWETATILKDQEIKRNNIIKALEYKAEEKDLYAKYLLSTEKHLKDKEKYLKNRDDFCGLHILYIYLKILLANLFGVFSIWLNRKSNNNGQNWERGVLFTISVWMLFFGVFYLTIPNDFLFMPPDQSISKLSMFTSELVRYFNPTNYELLINYLRTPIESSAYRFFSIFIYFMGKILIAYGIVGTVQAFRKLK